MQFLAKSGLELKEAASLKGKRVGVEAGTTNEQVIPLLGSEPQVVRVKSVAEGWEELQKGEIDIRCPPWKCEARGG